MIFGQVFSALPNIPVKQRGVLVIVLTLIFSIFTLGALVLTAYFVATAEAHTLPLRKIGEFVRPASPADVNDLVHYIRVSGKCEFAIPDIQEAELIVKTIEKSKISSKQEADFVRDWEQERRELKDSVCRLVLSYSKGALLASNFSRHQDAILENDIQSAKGGQVLYEGDRARELLVGVMERSETDRDRIVSSIVEAVSALVTVGYSNLYANFRYVPQRYVDSVDSDFLNFVNKVPRSYFDIVKAAIFSKETGEFVTFECDSPATSEKKNGSYSRFIVPVSLIHRHDILDRMKRGPWPLGQAQSLLSEQWWLRNAVWQMLAREHGKYRTGLGIRINEFGQCGPS